MITRSASGIRTLRDLIGKRVALPPDETAGNQNFVALAQHPDLPLDRITITTGPVNGYFAALERGDVDAMAFVRALRDPATIDAMRRLQQQGDGLFFVPVEQASAIGSSDRRIQTGLPLPSGSAWPWPNTNAGCCA